MKTYYKMSNSAGQELGRWVGVASENMHRMGEEINGTLVTTIIDDTPTPDLSEPIRVNRNELLAASDWTQVADAPVERQAWAAYRQELRDVTSQETFPFEVTWPVAPE